MAQAKEVRGPGPRGAGQPRPKVENPGLLLKRIMGEVFQHYLPHCIIVLICIVVSALANVQASLFLKSLIDDYIVPMTQQATPDFGPLTAALVLVIGPSRRLLGKLDAVVRISRAVVFERHIAAREVQRLLLIALRPAAVLTRGTPVLRPVVGFAGLSLPSGAVLLD